MLIHDQSSNMARLDHIWSFYMAKDRLPYERDWGNRTVIYPIGVEETTFAGSSEWAGLQLADLVAGAFADGARWAISGGDEHDKFRDELWHRVLLDTQTELPIWPRPEVDPKKLGTSGSDGSEVLDYIGAEMERVGFDPRHWRNPRRRR